jgi:hypothetical protein
MGYVDPERFKRFSQFLSRHISVFAAAAARGYAGKGKGAVIYRAPDDRFGGLLAGLRLEYAPKAQIDAAQGDTRDELLQGILDRYEPPGEAVFVAMYPDETYDVSRVTLGQGLQAPPSPHG